MKRHQSLSPTATSKKPKTFPESEEVQSDRADGDEWTTVVRRKQKKLRKVAVEDETAAPLFMYSNSEILKRNSAIGIDEIRELVLHLVADASPPNWLRIKNARAIDKVVALLVPGITPTVLSLSLIATPATSSPTQPIPIPLPSAAFGLEPRLPFFASTFSHACPTRAPGDHTRMHSVLNTFFHGPVSSQERKRRAEQRASSERSLNKDPAQYVLTLEQMIENDYPIPSYMADTFEKPPGWVETPEPPQESILVSPSEKKKTPIYAIDCEMCLTEDGKELTRVCLIDYDSGIVVYDQLVKPPKPIVDYLTRWSGITESALESVTTTLADVQTRFLSILSPSSPTRNTAVLLGHSLEFDLTALKLCHPRCIDTALVFHHPRGRPLKPGLAWLTKKWCGRDIQTQGDGGHDPEEDARACVDLLKKKVINGPGFGEFKMDDESIFERMSRSSGRGGPGSLRSAVVDHGNPTMMHGAKATTTVPCKSDVDVLDGLLQAIPAHDFIFGRFMGVMDALGWTTPKSFDPVPAPPPPPSAEDVAVAFATLDAQLRNLYTSLPARTALVIFTGHSDPRRMASLNARKSVFEKAIKSGITLEELDKDKWWKTADGRELEEEVELAKRGLLFLGVKPSLNAP